jgi:hypothetical protein
MAVGFRFRSILSQTKKARASAGLLNGGRAVFSGNAEFAPRPDYHLTSAGSLPPLAASLAITCLCSQMFMVAESLVSPV